MIIFCDELHFDVEHRYVKRIKRKRNARFEEDNIQRDSKARKAKNEFKETIHIFIVIGFNFRRMISYEMTTNDNDKMNTEIYIQLIRQLMPEMREKNLVLYQDQDSAHISKQTDKWMSDEGVDFVTGPPRSPDMSVMETWVSPLRRKFHARRTASKVADLKRFEKCFEELNQNKINNCVEHYRARLHDIFKMHDQMTKY
jgi:DDE superfamily endonuclease